MKLVTKVVIVLSSLLISLSSIFAQDCQDIPELSFSSPNYDGPNAYRFPSAVPGVDAIVRVTNSVNAALYDIDLWTTGAESAFQPQVQLLNQHTNGSSGYLDFQIDFVMANTNTPYVVDRWTVTAVDVDGDSYRLRESVGFSNFNMYTLESNTNLNISDASTTNMTVFEAYTTENLPGITTENSQHMVYMEFGGVSSFNIRTRIVDDGGFHEVSSADARMFSFSFDPCIIQDFQVPNTLPVEFSYFQVEKHENGALLNWETLVEINNDRFEIEKSLDGVTFANIGQIEGSGTSQAARQYRFLDTTPVEGNAFYRIKQVDFDGHFTYSEMKQINFTFGQADFYYTVYPNPSSDFVNVYSPSAQESTVASMIDRTGRIVKKGSLKNGELTFDVQQLPRGIYHISLSSETYSTTGKTIIIE